MHRLREHRVLRWVEATLWIAGCLAVGYCALAYFEAAVFQAYENREFERTLKLAAPPTPPSLSDRSMERKSSDRNLPESTLAKRTPARQSVMLSRLEIPRIDLSVMVGEGVASQALRLGAGHIPGTAYPAEVGNVGIAAHRDTFFRALRGIHRSDQITLTTLEGSYRYIVDWTAIVEPTDRAVLASSAEPVLTLVTCYPFNYIGAAPKRFIVRARRIE